MPKIMTKLIASPAGLLLLTLGLSACAHDPEPFAREETFEEQQALDDQQALQDRQDEMDRQQVQASRRQQAEEQRDESQADDQNEVAEAEAARQAARDARATIRQMELPTIPAGQLPGVSTVIRR